jgi:hypothetical protein
MKLLQPGIFPNQQSSDRPRTPFRQTVRRSFLCGARIPAMGSKSTGSHLLDELHCCTALRYAFDAA